LNYFPVEPPVRIELTTSKLQVSRSTKLS